MAERRTRNPLLLLLLLPPPPPPPQLLPLPPEDEGMCCGLSCGAAGQIGLGCWRNGVGLVQLVTPRRSAFCPYPLRRSRPPCRKGIQVNLMLKEAELRICQQILIRFEYSISYRRWRAISLACSPMSRADASEHWIRPVVQLLCKREATLTVSPIKVNLRP